MVLVAAVGRCGCGHPRQAGRSESRVEWPVDVGWLSGWVVESKGCGEEVGDPHEWRYCQDLTGVGGRNQPMPGSRQSSREPCPSNPHLPDGVASSAKRQETAYALDAPDALHTGVPPSRPAERAHIRHAAYGGDRFVTSGAAYGTGRGPLAGPAHHRPKHPHSATRTTTGDARCKLRAARGPAGWALALANELHPICRCVCARAVGGSECRGLRHYT
jgi:hypothetical protein